MNKYFAKALARIAIKLFDLTSGLEINLEKEIIKEYKKMEDEFI